MELLEKVEILYEKKIQQRKSAIKEVKELLPLAAKEIAVVAKVTDDHLLLVLKKIEDCCKKKNHKRKNDVQTLKEILIKVASEEIKNERQAISDFLKETDRIFSFCNPMRASFDILLPFSESYREIRHSKLLGYYLTPNKGKNIVDDLFLRRFFSHLRNKIINMNEQKVNCPNFPFDEYKKLQEDDCENAKVEIEWLFSTRSKARDSGRLDVKVTLGKQEFEIWIEAKVNADQGDNQLEDYTKKMPDNSFGIFLTREPDVESIKEFEGKWINLTWLEVASVGISYLALNNRQEDRLIYFRMWISSILRSFYGFDEIEEKPYKDQKRFKHIISFYKKNLGDL